MTNYSGAVLAKETTMREVMAMHAMQGLLADHKDHEEECRVTGGIKESCCEAVARLSVEHADALIAALTPKTP